MKGRSRPVKVTRAGNRHLLRLTRLNVGEMKKDGVKRSKWDLYKNAFRFAAKDVRGPRVTYIATKGRKIVGAVTLTEPQTARHGKGVVVGRHMVGVWVHPEHRGEKISSRLIDTALKNHPGEPIFAITEHESLQASLPKRRFEHLGNVVEGNEHPEVKVSEGKPLYYLRPNKQR